MIQERGIYCRYKPDIPHEEREALEQIIQKAGYKKEEELQKAELMVVYGGDGTMLYSVDEMLRVGVNIPIIGVMGGSLGFLTRVCLDELEKALQMWESDDLVEDRRSLLELVHRGEKYTVLNEIVISQQGAARVVHIDATINRHPLTTYRGDGVIIATPTGSTAYSLSAGGPLMHPQTPGYIVTPISPHSLSQKPVILHSHDVLVMKSCPKNPESLVITLDGRAAGELEPGEELQIQMSGEEVTLLKAPHDRFYETLKEKLGWG